MTVVVLIGLVFLAVGGALLLILAPGAARRRRAFIAGSTTAVGEIVGFREEHLGGDVFQHPRIRFRTASGALVEFTSQVGSERPRQRIGGVVPVRYRIDAPEDAEIDRWFALWGGVLLTGGLGAISLGIGLAALLGWIPA